MASAIGDNNITCITGTSQHELRIQNKFLVDRLEVWAERNFEERQKNINMTVDDVVAQSKHKQDFKKEQELAKTVDEVNERLKNLDGQGLGRKE